eukprot:GFUD01016389.1.p1 GENE.GFUD01016389.1~~GFUD01016389.1.p1  ORF type:complete len:266 (+),score=54.72 GFUD01016389.1:46-843(+)
MSLSSLGLSASQLQGLPSAWSPLFDICHFLLAALAVRKEVGVGFSRSNPLATWLATMTASFAGSMIANPLLGKPILGALSNEYNIMLASVIWWGVFYSPGDLLYSLAKNQVLYVPMCVVKEIYRAKKTLGGINDAAKVFPDQELLMVMIGLIKGNGSGFMRPVTRLVCGVWRPASTELLAISVTTKECLVAAMAIVACQTGHLSPYMSSDLLYLLIVSTFIMIKLAALVAQPIDPFEPLEQIGAYLALGGLWENTSGRNKMKKIE